jgi:hypothetical protein
MAAVGEGGVLPNGTGPAPPRIDFPLRPVRFCGPRHQFRVETNPISS